MDRTSVERPGRPLLRRGRSVPLGLALAAALVAMVAMPGASLAAAPPPPTGFTNIFTDDFNGAANTSPSGSNWIFDLGHGAPGGPPNWGTGEVESMSSSTSNVFQDGQGRLHIRALRDGSGNWTSGRLESQRADFQPPAGGVMRIQASIAMPNVSGNGALGYWPAFWALGAPIRSGGVWPSVGELDFMESINAVATEFGTLHCGTNPGGPCNESTGIGGTTSCSTCWGSFHTYTFEWDKSVSPETLRWSLDGTQFFSINSTRVDATTWANATNHPYFLMLDLPDPGGELQRQERPAADRVDDGHGRRAGRRLHRQRRLSAVQQRQLRLHRADAVRGEGGVRSRKRGQRPGRGAPGQPQQPGHRQLRHRQHRRLAELADGAREHERHDGHPHRVPEVRDRLRPELRERQLLHVQPLSGTRWAARPGGPPARC